MSSRFEIIYHLIRQTKVDLAENEEYICFQRAMCKAEVRNENVCDARSYINDNWNFHDDPPYEHSNKIGINAKSLGFEGLLYPSKRA